MVRKIARRTAYNRMWKEHVKEAVKALDQIISQEPENKDKIKAKYTELQKAVDKASKNGVIHKNKAARIKSKKSPKDSG